jgi:uncharacterized RDD family membrane protein YckC
MAKRFKSVGLGKRAVAYFIDDFLIAYIFAVLSEMAVGYDYTVGLFTLLFGLSWVVYPFIKDGIFNGKSIGKRIMRLKVIDYQTKKSCSVKQSIKRNLVFLVPLMPIIEAHRVHTKPKHRRWGDNWANTIVVEE